MNKMISLVACAFIFASCSEKKADTPTTETVSKPTEEVKPKPEFLKSIAYSDWEMGDPQNIKPVLDFYTFWDKQDIANLTNLFADSVRLRIPDERKEIVASHDKVYEGLKQNRDMYTSATNEVLSAVSLHDRQRNEDWVITTVYTKWIEKDGKRDSVMFSDNWRLKDGKIAFLLSFDKKPTSTFLNNNDPKKK